MPIDLYTYPASGPCRAVAMTASHLGVELNPKYVDLFAQEQMKPEFLKMNPQHTVPTIDDNGFVLWESRAIQTYLVDKYSPGNSIYPKDPQARAVVDRVLYFDIGTLQIAQRGYVRPVLFEGKQPDPEKLENYKKAVELLEGFLSKTPYVAGNHLTLADFSIFGTLSFAVQVADYSITAYPKISAWMKKLKSEIPDFEKINDQPLREFKERLKSKTL